MARRTESGERDGESTLRRRGYLKAVGAAVASVGALETVAETAAAAEYETVTLSSGEERTFSVGSGETLENLLVDARASGADVHISASGEDWTVRNVGVRGSFDVGSDSGGFSNVLSVEGTGLVENVYLGDGHDDGVRKGAVGSPADHSGHVTFRNCNVTRWTGNAVYAAGAGRINPPGQTDGGGGSYAFDTCHFQDNNIAHLRIASDGTEVRGCTFVNTGNVPPHPSTAGGESGVVNSRGIYTGYGDPSQTITVRDCDIAITDSNTNGAASALVSGTHGTYGDLTIIDVDDSQVSGDVRGDNVRVGSNVGSNPDTSVPSAVPTSAEQAAGATATSGSSGGSGDSSSDGSSSGDGSDESDDSSSSGSDDETDSGSGGSGSSGRSSGGEPVDDDDGGAGSEPVGTISISGTDEVADYAFSVGGSLERSTANDATIDAEDSVSGSRATGAVAGGVDSYEFTGEVAAFSLDGDASVTRNGDPFDPSSVPDQPQSSGSESDAEDDVETEDEESGESRVLSISGDDWGVVVDYSLAVSGSLERSTANDATIDAEDSVSGSRATGAVAGGVDSYEFTGEVTDFDIGDGATVTLDGEEVAPSQLAG